MMKLDDHESMLRRELAKMHQEYSERAKPIIDQLVKIQSLKPIPPMIIDIDKLPQELLDQLKSKGQP